MFTKNTKKTMKNPFVLFVSFVFEN
jgi:hypothetical protein